MVGSEGGSGGALLLTPNSRAQQGQARGSTDIALIRRCWARLRSLRAWRALRTDARRERGGSSTRAVVSKHAREARDVFELLGCRAMLSGEEAGVVQR